MSWRVIGVCIKDFGALAASGARSVRSLMLLPVLFVCLLLGACHSHRRHQMTSSLGGKPVLSASPNPVPAGDIDKPVGNTTITWDTGNGAIGDLYVKVDRQPEVLVARAPSGTHEVRWIQFDCVYEFRLYTKKRSRLLAKLEVTRDDD